MEDLKQGDRVKKFKAWNKKRNRMSWYSKGVVEFVSECGRYARVKARMEYAPRYAPRSTVYLLVSELELKT